MKDSEPTSHHTDDSVSDRDSNDDDSTTDRNPQLVEKRSVLSPLTSGILLIVSLGWLSLYILSLYHMLGSELASNEGAVVVLALSLSGFFLGGFFAGTVMGLIWGEWSTHAKGPAAYLSRPFMALFGALLVAMAAGVTVFLLFLNAPGVAGLLSGSLALSIVIGGCLGITKRSNPIAAGVVAFVPLLLLMAIRGYAMDPIFNLLEDMGDFDRLTGYQASQTILNLVAGIICGLVAFTFLLSKRGGTLWTHMVAGGIPGVIWLTAEIFNGITGHLLLNLVADLSILDQATRHIALEAQLNGALTVLFAGATTAVLAFGLLLPKANEEKVADSAEDADDITATDPEDTKDESATDTADETDSDDEQRPS